jgi:histidine triad (HIT) family protein
MKCIFCNIIAKESPAEILFEDDKVISFLDKRPVNFGHALVVPKFHCSTFLDMPAEIVPDVFVTAQKVAKCIHSALKLDGFNIVINTGRIAGQSVFHFHLHIIPRSLSDTMRFKPQFKKYDNGQISEIGLKIRQQLEQF